MVVGGGGAARDEFREIGGAGGVEVTRVEQGGAGDVGEGVGALPADEAAADNGEISLLGVGAVHSVSKNDKAKPSDRGTQVTF